MSSHSVHQAVLLALVLLSPAASAATLATEAGASLPPAPTPVTDARGEPASLGQAGASSYGPRTVAAWMEASPERLDPSDPASAARLVGHRMDLDANGVEDILDLLAVSSPPLRPLRVIVVTTDVAAAQDLLPRLGALGAREAQAFRIIPAVAAALPSAALGELVATPGVVRVYHDAVARASLDSSTPVVRAAQARAAFGVDGSGVGIAIIDTGVDATHVSLDDQDDNNATNDPKVVGWYDAIAGSSTPYDDHGHGTHVASTAAGTAAGSPYVGVAPGASIIGVKVLSGGGSGSESDVIEGVEWSVAQKDALGIDIISMSLGASINGDGDSPMELAVESAMHNGVVAVVAAGNSGPGANTVGIPASARDIVTVGAVEDSTVIAGFSSRGTTADGRLKPEVSAPGVDVTAARANSGNGYRSASGTSMATPHVSGVVALMLDHAGGGMDTSQVRDLLMETAVDKGDPGADNTYGAGVVDAVEATNATIPRLHDVAIRTVVAPRWVSPGTPSHVNVTVRNQGLANETDLRVRLLQDGTEVASADVPSLASRASANLSLNWTAPVVEGTYALQAVVEPVPGENATANNARSTSTRVVEIAGHVQVVVADSPGIDYAGYFAWRELEDRWYDYGNRTITVDLRSLAGKTISVSELEATGADVLAIPDACCGEPSWLLDASEVAAIEEWTLSGHGAYASLGTFSSDMAGHAPLADLFGVAGVQNARRCEAISSNVTFAPGSAFGARIGASYYPGMDCATSGLTSAGAQVEANDTQGIGQVFSRKVGGAATAYVTWGSDITGFGASRDDVQLTYNAFGWLKDNAVRPAIDVGVANVRAPAFAWANESFNVSANVRNYGTQPAPPTNASLVYLNATAAVWPVPALAPGESFALEATLVAPATPGVREIRFAVEPVPGDEVAADDERTARVRVATEALLLLQQALPWTMRSNEDVLDANDIAYLTASPDELGNLTLGRFYKVVIASDQPQQFYDALDAERARLESYVATGGTLEIHAADLGWNGGQWTTMPGGLQHRGECIDRVEPQVSHEIFRTPHPLTSADLAGWGCSTHGIFTTLPAASQILAIKGNSSSGVIVEAWMGNGTILATTQTLEFRAYSDERALENVLLYRPVRLPIDATIGSIQAADRHAPGEVIHAAVTVVNSGRTAFQNATVEIFLDDTSYGVSRLSRVEPGAAIAVDFDVPGAPSGWHQLTARVSAAGDGDATDDSAVRGLLVAPPGQVLALDVGYDEGWRALEAAGVPRCDGAAAFCYDLVSPDAFTTENLSRHAAIFVASFADGATLSALGSRAADIEAFVAAGGGVVAYSQTYQGYRWLPGGNATEQGDDGDEVVLLPEGAAHPALANQTSESLSGWANSFHSSFVTWPAYLRPLALTAGNATVVLAGNHGDGCVFATGLHPEHGLWDIPAALQLISTSVRWAADCAGPLPDVQVVGLRALPPNPREGDLVTVTATVVNAGEAGSGPFFVDVTIDNTTTERWTLDLAPGRLANVSVTWVATPGTHGAFAVADPEGLLAEADESNNAASLLLKVAPRPTALPDLVVTILDVQKPTLRTDLGEVAPNPVGEQRILVEACNIGNATLRYGVIGLSVHARTPRGLETSDGIGSRELSLAAGACETITFLWEPLGAVGDITYVARGFGGEERDLRNNEGRRDGFVLVGGAGGVVAPLP